MDITKLRAEYSKQLERARRLKEALCEQIEQILAPNNITLGVPIESRVKSLESLEEKLERRSLDLKSILDLNDLVGIRIILLFLRDVAKVGEVLSKTFDVLSTEDAATRLAEAQFGYQSLHHIIRLPKSWLEIPTFSDLGELKAEIQVRTLAQHIWAAASHKLQYKHEKSVPLPIRRSIHRASALLETVDLEFERVLGERGTYIAEATHSSISDDTLNVDLLASVLSELLPGQNREDNEPYADLLIDLAEFGVNSTKQLRSLIQRNLENVLKEEVSILHKRRRDRDYFGCSKARIERGVFFTFVGLTREALRQEFKESFSEYMQNRRTRKKLII